jgi:hypothetical protein
VVPHGGEVGLSGNGIVSVSPDVHVKVCSSHFLKVNISKPVSKETSGDLFSRRGMCDCGSAHDKPRHPLQGPAAAQAGLELEEVP